MKTFKQLLEGQLSEATISRSNITTNAGRKVVLKKVKDLAKKKEKKIVSDIKSNTPWETADERDLLQWIGDDLGEYAQGIYSITPNTTDWRVEQGMYFDMLADEAERIFKKYFKK